MPYRGPPDQRPTLTGLRRCPAMRELRFGVGRGDGRSGSPYWNLKSAAKRPDLYLRGNRTGAFFGVSLHEDPDHWHWKIHRPHSPPEYKAWRRPPPFVPGHTRAIELAAHVSEGRTSQPGRPRETSRLVPAPEDRPNSLRCLDRGARRESGGLAREESRDEIDRSRRNRGRHNRRRCGKSVRVPGAVMDDARSWSRVAGSDSRPDSGGGESKDHPHGDW